MSGMSPVPPLQRVLTANLEEYEQHQGAEPFAADAWVLQDTQRKQ
jgi:hypothetical protein